MGIKVFVYGTLLSGFGNYNYYLKNNAKLVDKNATVVGFKMYNIGHFPACVHNGLHDNIVQGEVYNIDEEILKRLDRLEGYPRLYDRIIVNPLLRMEYPIHKDDMIWIYTLKEDQISPSSEEIRSGNWREFYKERRGD